MSPPWNPIENGDSVTASGINAQFSAVETLVNDISAGDVVYGALTREHLPSVVADADMVSIAGDHEYTVDGSPYDPSYTSATNWTRIQSDGESGTADDLSITTSLELTIGSVGVSTAKDGVLVLFNGHIKIIRQMASSSGFHDIHAIFRIIATDGSGNTRCVAESERFADSELGWYHGVDSSIEFQYKLADIGIRQLITQADVADGTLTKVEVGIAVVNATKSTLAITGTVLGKCVLTGCNLSIIAFDKLLTGY